MGVNVKYMFELCTIFAVSGLVSTFFLSPTSSAIKSENYGEWSSWSVVQTQPCLRLRSRNCLPKSNICTTDEEFSLCPVVQWGEWGPTQCTITTGVCVIARTRNCSVPTIKDCKSPEKDREIHVWGDMKTCPCRKGGTIDSAQNNGQWEDWSSWQCQRSADSCYVFRTRHCSVADTKNCPPKGSSQLKLWEGTCPCENVSESISTSSPPSTTTTTTTVSTVATVSSTLLTTQRQPLIQTTYASHWLEWGEWNCHSVGFGCVQTRWRNCSAEDRIKCNGNSYELNSCTQNTCKDSSPDATTASPLAKWTQWGPWECHNEQIPCVLYRYRNCSTFEIDCEAKGGSNYELMTCGDMCAVPDKASTTDTSTVDISTPVTTSSNTTPFSVTYWLEWGSWDCKKQETGLCLMARTRNCSTYNPDDCEIKVTGTHYELRPCDTDICAAQSSAQWSDWFYGKCSVSCGNGTTNRLRHCSTGHDEDCAGSPFETVPCTATDCSVLKI